MSWSIKMAGPKTTVARALREYKSRPNTFPDVQRDALFEAAAAQIENMNIWQGSVLVEGNGHQGSTFKLEVTGCEIVSEPPVAQADPVAQSPAGNTSAAVSAF